MTVDINLHLKIKAFTKEAALEAYCVRVCVCDNCRILHLVYYLFKRYQRATCNCKSHRMRLVENHLNPYQQTFHTGAYKLELSFIRLLPCLA